ncbi:MAG: hypothetical protein LC623_05055, partial [Halobacteriales archaeon]|nr:hypothetical protein [Halobacteriales archaeon]
MDRFAMAPDGGEGTYNGSAVRTSDQYPLNPDHLADQVAESGRLTVTATNGDRLTLLLTEFNAFAGNRSYITYDSDGHRIEKPFLGRMFEGVLLSDPSSHASMLIAPEGLYGSVESHGKVWSFQPTRNQQPAADGTIIQEVSSYDIPASDPANFLCRDDAKVGVSVSAQNTSAVEGKATCPLAVASCFSVGTCVGRSELQAHSGRGICAGWADDASSDNATVSCQVGGPSFAVENATAERTDLESSPDCSTFMDKWAAYSGDASVAVLLISQNSTLNSRSYVWNQGTGCTPVQPRCMAQA